jgi:hypothetical protein
MLEKLQTRNDDLARQISLAHSQERSARAALRTAESSARSLREEMVRLKTTVQQVRTSCANDVRKRDVQIQRLKTHLTSQQRGNKTGLVGASITINPGTIGMGGNSSIRDDALDVDDPEYSLKQETTEFLTQLSQSLSDENDNLIGLVRTTIMTLKELQGMPESQRLEHGEELSTIGEEDESTRSGMLQALPASYETLASDLDAVLENLKNLLTNPNFVSLEEVESREHEILRLRAGWEKMERRLREAFALMEAWRKRMADGGDTINLDELSRGLVLGLGLEDVNKEEDSVVTEDEDDDDDEGVSSGFDELDQQDEAGDLEDLPSPETDDVPEETTNSDMFKLKLQPDPLALKESNGNARSPVKSPRKVAFSASIPNTPSQLEDENAEVSAIDLVGAEKPFHQTSPLQERVSRPIGQDNRTPRHVRCDNIADQIIRLASKVTFSSSPSNCNPASALKSDDDLQAKKRLSSPHAHPDERSPKLTVQDKLKAAQAEAEAAAIAENLKVQSTKAEQIVEVVQRERKLGRASRSPMKTRISGRPKRRKSTLTPEELDHLLLGA